MSTWERISEFAIIGLGLLLAVAVELVRAWRKGEKVLSGEVAKNSFQNAVFATAFLSVVQTLISVAHIERLAAAKFQPDALTAAKAAMGNNPLFVAEASRRMDEVTQTLESVASGGVDLNSPEDVTSTWLRLIRASGSQIRATNVIAPDFWKTGEHMGKEAEEAHRDALAKGVKIRRLYIYNAGDERTVSELKTLADRYAALGVENRFVPTTVIDSLVNQRECIGALSTTDFVVFDEAVVLLVAHSSSLSVVGGRLSQRRDDHVNVAIRCFERWWNVPGAKPIP